MPSVARLASAAVVSPTTTSSRRTNSSSSTTAAADRRQQQRRVSHHPHHLLRFGRRSSVAVVAAMSSSGGDTSVTTTTTPEILRKLQNGSDVRGVALPGVEGEPVTLNEEAAYLIGAAFIDWLAEEKGKLPGELTVGVGRDPRLSGQALAWGGGETRRPLHSLLTPHHSFYTFSRARAYTLPNLR